MVTAICTLLQVVAENVNSNKIMVYFVTLPKKPDYVDKVKKIMETLPDVDLNIVRIKEEDILDHKKITSKADAVFMYDLLADKKVSARFLYFKRKNDGVLLNVLRVCLFVYV